MWSLLAHVGYRCDPHNNPPDFFLDVINGDTAALAMCDERVDSAEVVAQSPVNSRPKKGSAVSKLLSVQFQRSKLWHE